MGALGRLGMGPLGSMEQPRTAPARLPGPTMRTHGNQRITRRTLIRKVLGVSVGLPALGLLASMIQQVRERDLPTRVTLPPDLPTGLSVRDGVLVNRQPDGRLQAFLACCSHLGCRIDRVVGDEAVCPCHGSRYRADGAVAQGPAARPLEPLALLPDAGTGGWIARVPA